MNSRPLLSKTLALFVLIGLFQSLSYSQTLDESPEEVLSQYGELLKARKWAEAGMLMHPEALARLRELFSPLIAAPLGQTGKDIFKVSSKEAFDRLSDIDIYERFMAFFKEASEVYPGVATSESRIIGNVKEGTDLVHIVYRVHTRSRSMLAREMVVVSLKRDGAKWRLLLSGNVEAMVMLFSETFIPIAKEPNNSESNVSCLPPALLDFAIPKWKADKAVRTEDAYKWLYQATRGGEHAAPDEDSARKWLDQEWVTLSKPAKNEPGWEPLCPGSEVGRLNLRPFKHAAGKENDLLAAFLASSREYRPDPADFIEAWNQLGERLQKHPFGKLNHRTWQKVDSEMKPQNYPAIHHSKPYENARHPAYRVLTKAQAQKLIPID